MPTYDFICNTCNQRFDVFQTFNEYGKKSVNCTHCSSADVRRRMTKVRIAKSETSRMESMTAGVDNIEALENDPQALAQMMRKMGSEMGEDLPPEFDDVVDRLEAGQSPEEIESALPDLGPGMQVGMSNLNSTHKSTRLDLIDQDLDRTIKTYNTKKAKNAIQLLAKYIKDQGKIDDSVIELCIDHLSKGEKVPKELLRRFRISAENLEIKYLTASDDFEAGLADEEQVINLFSTARIAAALLWATEADPYTALAEMIYEAHASLQNLDELKKIVLSVE